MAQFELNFKSKLTQTFPEAREKDSIFKRRELTQKTEEMKAGKILLGILSGAAAGAMAGILFAPKKGRDTRRSIANKSNEYLDETRHKFSDLADDMSHRYDKVKTKVKGKSRKVGSKMDGEDKIVY